MPKAKYILQGDGTVYCPKCKKNCDISHFHVANMPNGKVRYSCKIDNKNLNSGGRNRRKRNNFPYMSLEYQRDYRLLRKFGINTEEYNKIFQEQGGCCDICKRHQSEFDIALCVDHNHETGKIRGLLCTNCNAGIGMLKDNSSVINSAINYLKTIKVFQFETIKTQIKYQKGSFDYFKNKRLLSTFDISLTDYKMMLDLQCNSCAICKLPENGKDLSVDHDHSNGRVRGLLCNKCNTGIGMFFDNTNLLKNAIDYLNKHER